jgi:hypothetical protein
MADWAVATVNCGACRRALPRANLHCRNRCSLLTVAVKFDEVRKAFYRGSVIRVFCSLVACTAACVAPQSGEPRNALPCVPAAAATAPVPERQAPVPSASTAASVTSATTRIERPVPVAKFAGCVWRGKFAEVQHVSATAAQFEEFVSLRHADVQVELDDGASGLAKIEAETQGFVLHGFARALDVRMYPQKDVAYLGVFHPWPWTSWSAIAHGATEISVVPELDVGVKLNTPSPWIVPCNIFGLEPGDFQIAEHASMGGGSSMNGVLELTPTPGAPAVLKLPEGAYFEVASARAGFSLVFWTGARGTYRGFAKSAAIAPGGGGIGLGRMGYGGGPATAETSCSKPRGLFARTVSGHWFRVGEVRKGVAVAWHSPDARTSADGMVIRVVQPPAALVLSERSLLAAEVLPECDR